MSDLTQWSYKRSHSITSSTELTDYQVKIRVYRTEGTSTGDTVYLGSKCLADYGDIRFVASNDTTELSYWMETNAGSYADFWVKVPSIVSDSSIYIYYGNSSATTTSNDLTTFYLVDLFDDSSLDTSKWTQQSLGVCSETGGYLEIQGSTYTWDTAGLTTAAGVKNTGISISGPFSIWCSLTYDVSQAAAFGIIHLLIHSSTDNAYIGLNDSIRSYEYGYTWDTVTAAINAGYGTVDTSRKTTGTVTLKITRDSSNVCKLYWNGQLQYSNTLTGTINQLTLSNCRYNANTGTLSRFNFVYAGGYAETEPTHGDWSTEQEEEVTSYPLKITINPSSGTDPLSVSYNLSISDALDDFVLNFGDGDIYLTPLSTTTVLSKSTFNSTTLNVIGYTIRSIIAANTLSAGGEYIQLELRRPYEGTLFITNVSIVERDGSTANGITIPTEITFNNGQSGVTLSSTGDLYTFSDFVYFPFDRTKAYLVIYDISPLSTSTSPSRWTGGSSYLKANTQSWNQQNLTSTTTSSFVFFIRRIHTATRPPQTTFTTSHTYNTPGTYTVWAEGYNEFATHVYYEIPYGVTVSAPSVVASFTTSQSYNTVTFTNTSTGNINEWYWDFGDGNHSYEQNPTHTYYSPATYTVTLYASNQYQYDHTTDDITITQVLTPPEVYFTPNNLNVISPTLPYTVNFTNLSTPAFGCTYNWLIDGTTYTTENPSHSFTTYGMYDVGLTVTNALGSATKTYNDAIRITRKGKTFYEVINYADTPATFHVEVFNEVATSTDTIIQAHIFDESINFVQDEVPDEPGLDEWGMRHFYLSINEWGHRIINAVTDWGHRILYNGSTLDNSPVTLFKAQEFREDVVFIDEWEFGTT